MRLAHWYHAIPSCGSVMSGRGGMRKQTRNKIWRHFFHSLARLCGFRAVRIPGLACFLSTTRAPTQGGNMGKVSKRQRKFLSKSLLPHRKKGGARRTDGKDKQGARGSTFAAEKQLSAAPQERKTLPDGVNTEAFQECQWLSQKSCNASPTDSNVDPFRVEESVLESLAKSVSVSNKRSKPSSSSRDSGLSAETVQAMLGRAVDEGSVNELILTVRSLELSFSRSASPPSAAEIELRAEPGSRAWNALRKDGFGRLHVAFMTHLGPNREDDNSIQQWEEAVDAHRQQFVKAKAWPHLGSALLAFLTAALDSLGMPETETESTAAVSKAHTKDAHKRGAIVEGLARMRHHLSFLFPFPRLARRYLSYLLGILETTDDDTSISLAFLRLYELSTSQPMPFLHDAFKGAYRAYRAAVERIGGDGRSAVIGVRAGVLDVGGGGNESLSLLRECLAELFGVEKPSAYLHAYVFIHELVREALGAAAEVAKLGAGVREAGPALRRLRSWGFLQRLLLWTSIVGAHAGKASLGPLVPPLTKVLEISFQLSPGLFGAPRTLAMARSAQNLAAAAGIYLPTSQHLIGLLELLYPSHSGVASSKEAKERLDDKKTQEKDSNSGGKKWHSGFREEGGVKSDDAGDIVDLSAVAGLSKEDLRLGAVQAAVSRKAANLIVREMTCYRWSSGLPELCASTQARLERLLEGEFMSADGGASGRFRARLKSTIAAVGRASAEAEARRGKGDKHPGGAAPIDTFRGSEEPSATQRLQLFKEPF